MGVKLNGSRYSTPGSRVPSELLPTAIRYESARAKAFEYFGQYERANECWVMKDLYERRNMQEN